MPYCTYFLFVLHVPLRDEFCPTRIGPWWYLNLNKTFGQNVDVDWNNLANKDRQRGNLHSVNNRLTTECRCISPRKRDIRSRLIIVVFELKRRMLVINKLWIKLRISKAFRLNLVLFLNIQSKLSKLRGRMFGFLPLLGTETSSLLLFCTLYFL